MTGQVPTKHRSAKLWIATLVVAAIVIVFLGRQRVSSTSDTTPDHPGEKPAPAAATDVVAVDPKNLQQISTQAVQERLVTVDRKATGKIGFNEDRLTPVFTPYTGRIVDLLASKGDTVRAAQPLVVIESPDFVAAQNDLAGARSDVAKAKIGLDTSQVAAERARRLHQQEALSTKDLQQVEADLARAQDELRRAQTTLAAVENRLALFGKDTQEIARLGEHADSRITLRAPIAGTIVDRKIGPGQYVKPDAPDPLFMISDLSTLWVLADIFESDVAGIHMNMPVDISVAAYPEHVFPARISFISPTVDPTTRTVRVRCLVANPNRLLKPDMFANIKIGAAAKQSVAVIPSTAVVVEGNDNLVFVQESPGRFRRRQIQVGAQVGDTFMVNSGLTTGEVVATRGALLLEEVGKSK